METVRSGRELMVAVRRRQMVFLGHIVRADGLENLAMTSRIAAARNRGKPRRNIWTK